MELKLIEAGKENRFDKVTILSLQININLENLTLSQLEKVEQFANGIIKTYKETYGTS